MRLADEIREFVYENYIKYAVERGETEVLVRAGDVHSRMSLSNRMPAVCDALNTKKFLDLCNNRLKDKIVRLKDRTGPKHGASACFVFEIVDK